MTNSRAHASAAVFDIEHGRQLHRLRPDLAQGAAVKPRDPSPGAARRSHALDALWEEEAAGPGSGTRRAGRREAPRAGGASSRGRRGA